MATVPCERCRKGVPLPGEPKGTIDQSSGAYFIAGEGQSGGPKTAVVLLTDAFGLPLNNCKIIADAFSERLGCDVWVPDIFIGRPLFGVDELVEHLPEQAGEKMSVMNMLHLFLTILRRLPNIVRHRPSRVDARIDTFIGSLRAEHKYEMIGAVGYCFGGAAAIRLGGRELVQTIVTCHPGPFSNAELRAISVPISWACAEGDMWFTAKTRLKTEASLSRRKEGNNPVDYEFRLYKGTVHGFAARPNLGIPEVKTGFEGALDQAVEWFKMTLFT